MYLYSAKENHEIDYVSEDFLYINDFGYCEDFIDTTTNRENGRLDYQLIYVASGSLIVQEQNEKRLISREEVCLFRPKEPQIYSTDGNTTYYWIHFSGTEVEKMLSFFKKRSYHVGVFTEFEQYCRMAWSGFAEEQESNELLLCGKLITLMAYISQSVNQDGKKRNELSRLRPAIEIMKSECNVRRSNEELASLCGINKYYFIKLFNKNVGVSPQGYYAKLIVSKSCNLLRSTTYSVSQIAKICGVEDPLYFSRLFKKHMGVSPFTYRKNN